MNAVPDLEVMLQRATAADNWSQVIHRCAWCRRVFDENGAYGNVVALHTGSVATDGMCPACGARALRQIAARRAGSVAA
jgi:hypothetical protein